jgi:hypothetical protein
LEFLPRARRQKEEINTRNSVEKKVIKLSLFASDMTLYLKDQRNVTKKLLCIINTFSKEARYKIILQESVTFLFINNEQSEKEYRKTIPFTKASKNSIPRNKLNKGGERPLQ